MAHPELKWITNPFRLNEVNKADRDHKKSRLKKRFIKASQAE